MDGKKIKAKLFNPEGNDFVFGAPFRFFDSPLTQEPTGLFTIFNPTDPDIYEFVKLQKQRLWKADEYPINRVQERFDELDEKDRKLFEYTLSFLSFLDSVQVANLSDINVVSNMPEYRLWYTVHQYFEHEHAIAYSNILMGLFDNNPEEVKRIFYLSKDYPALKKRNELIANNYQKLFDIFWEGIKNVKLEDYARALTYVLAGTYAMESLTFYMGFRIIEFYQYKYGVLPITNKMISEIKADELFHVKVMSTVIKRARPHITKYISNQEFEDIIRSTMRAYLESDLEFYHSILQDNNFGITDKMVDNYLKWIYHRRMKLLGFDTEYSNIENPFADMERLYGFFESHDNSTRKDSFFESKSSAYLTEKIEESVLDEFEF